MTDSSPEFQRVLAIETATRYQAVALLDGDQLLEHRIQRVRYNHGSSLLGNIDHLLNAQGVEVADVDLFCVGLGPGSFTGLRVGLATAKALARATDRPIVGVSSLAALAQGAARTHPKATILAAIDARRREVYAAAYRWNDGQLECVLDACALSPARWRERVEKDVTGPLIQIGDGVPRYAELAQWAGVITMPQALAPPSAVSVALLGRLKARTLGPADLITLEPDYIRPSDARLPDRPLRSIPELDE